MAIAKDAPTLRIRPQDGPQMAFLSSEADIAVYGGGAGAGKSFAMLLEPLRHCETRGFDGVIFRRTTPEITNPGALWDEAGNLYPRAGGVGKFGALEWNWPSGATIAFRHMEHESDKLRYQGPSFAFIGFDELTHFSETQFWYLLSRNRSTCGVRPYIRATCNPDADSWVAELLAWWIDAETGYPITERSGVIRWLQRRDGVLYWHDSREESIDAAREAGVSDADNLPKSLTFIAACLEDNPALTSKDPGYRAGLLALPLIEQERLLRGNWRIRTSDGAMWGDECFAEAHPNWWPEAFEASIIAIDPAQGKDNSDYSALVFVGVSGGLFWVDAAIDRIGKMEIGAQLAEMYRELRPSAVVMESNANQADAYGPPCQQAAIDAGLGPLPLFFQHQSVKKEHRIRRLHQHMLNGHFRFRPNSPGCKLLESQLKAFPLKCADDGPDALEHAVWQLKLLLSGANRSQDLVEAF